MILGISACKDKLMSIDLALYHCCIWSNDIRHSESVVLGIIMNKSKMQYNIFGINSSHVWMSCNKNIFQGETGSNMRENRDTKQRKDSGLRLPTQVVWSQCAANNAETSRS